MNRFRPPPEKLYSPTLEFDYRGGVCKKPWGRGGGGQKKFRVVNFFSPEIYKTFEGGDKIASFPQKIMKNVYFCTKQERFFNPPPKIVLPPPW